ncbi:succinylarginine dihydrolase [Rhizobium subbaraonis]|uniref:Succinylarginine dihydrolase n=2 Tax=Rhizobium subbaraonis TaxID=908946 RepID=A0A285UHU6_9HYPH|nr:succinylarginine dihydrolase [Rhizobium subbaraonis]
MWPETNCYVDLWIEVLHALGLSPEAMLGFTLTQDFEGDQFTFFKVPLEDLEALYGIRCTELAVYDRVERHVAEQIGRGRLCLVEMDSFYMPDTRGVGYRQEHGKTTVAINRLDLEGRVLDYFHNAGFFRLEGEDFDGLFQMNASADALPFLPYTEFAKFPSSYPSEADLLAAAHRLLRFHFARRPRENPIAAFAGVFPGQVQAVAERPFGFFHKYAFNTLRQVGANFELAASHLDWLAADGSLAPASDAARRISEVAKSVQFQLARAVTRKRFEPLATALDPAVEAWEELMQVLSRHIG